MNSLAVTVGAGLTLVALYMAPVPVLLTIIVVIMIVQNKKQ
jgi:hypothetical protein